MINLSFTIGQIKVTPLFWSLFLAFVISSFSIWRRLIKEDYREQDIFGINLLMLLSGVIYGGLTNYLIGDWLWGCLFGAIIIFILRVRAIKHDTWEGLDSLSKSWLYFLFLIGVGKFLSLGDSKQLGYCSVALIGLTNYLYFKKKYRTLSWYKSGKMGFLFWSVILSTSLALVVLDFCQKNRLYFTELLWGVSALTSGVLILYRAEINKK